MSQEQLRLDEAWKRVKAAAEVAEDLRPGDFIQFLAVALISLERRVNDVEEDVEILAGESNERKEKGQW